MSLFSGKNKRNSNQTVQVTASIKEKTTGISITPQKNLKQIKARLLIQKTLTTKYTENATENQYKKET